jgi:hypothetical protein
VVQCASADNAAAAHVSLLLSDGHGDVRLLCARDVECELDAKLGDKSQQPQSRRVVEHGRQQAALLSIAPAWVKVASREVSKKECESFRVCVCVCISLCLSH